MDGERRTIIRSGSVLILALWALFFLGALAVAVGSHVSAVIAVARHARSGMQARLLAAAGVERAIAAVSNSPTNWDGVAEGEFRSDEALFKENRELENGFFSVYYTYVSTNGGMTVTNYGVVCEGSRVNLNRVGHSKLVALFRERAGVDETAAADIAASIKDWRDRDDVALTGGAEDAYYQGLAEGYPCANTPFRRPEELLLVKGVTPEVYEAVAPYVTVYGDTCYRGTAEGAVRSKDRREARGDVRHRVHFVADVRDPPRVVYWRAE